MEIEGGGSVGVVPRLKWHTSAWEVHLFVSKSLNGLPEVDLFLHVFSYNNYLGVWRMLI